VETTFQFQSRLFSIHIRSRGRKDPLLFLEKMEKLTRQMFLQYNGKTTFIGKPEDFPLLCKHLFLTASLALVVDLGLAIRTKYPGFCPYCYVASCQCKGMIPRPPYRRWNGQIPQENSLAELQEMLRSIYPPERHTLEHQVAKLLEEIRETREAIQNSPLVEVQEELSDIFARLAPLAHTLKMPLSQKPPTLIR
jgi:NTP pyrophosphatase (non-canonical NTP hydrolase)